MTLVDCGDILACHGVVIRVRCWCCTNRKPHTGTSCSTGGKEMRLACIECKTVSLSNHLPSLFFERSSSFKCSLLALTRWIYKINQQNLETFHLLCQVILLHQLWFVWFIVIPAVTDALVCTVSWCRCFPLPRISQGSAFLGEWRMMIVKVFSFLFRVRMRCFLECGAAPQ